jgi:hypothetical protein
MTIHAFKRIVAATAMAMAMSLLGACKSGGDEDTGDAKIRLLNLSTGYSSLDLITNLDAEDDDEDETQSAAVALNSVSQYVTLDPDDYTIKLKRTGSGSILRSFAGEELVEGTINTYVAYGEVGAFGALRLDDTQDEADAGETKLSVANVSSAGALDVLHHRHRHRARRHHAGAVGRGPGAQRLLHGQRDVPPACHRQRRQCRRAARHPGFLPAGPRHRHADPHRDPGWNAGQRGLSTPGG